MADSRHSKLNSITTYGPFLRKSLAGTSVALLRGVLRIVEGHRNGVRTLRLEGRVVDRWVEEVRRSCAESADLAALVLDLSGVSFLDSGGVHLLRALQHEGAQLVHPSPFVAEQLKTAADTPPSEHQS